MCLVCMRAGCGMALGSPCHNGHVLATGCHSDAGKATQRTQTRGMRTNAQRYMEDYGIKTGLIGWYEIIQVGHSLSTRLETDKGSIAGAVCAVQVPASLVPFFLVS